MGVTRPHRYVQGGNECRMDSGETQDCDLDGSV